MGETDGGFGRLAPLLRWPGVTDILVNGTNGTWVDGPGGLRAVPLALGEPEDVYELAVSLIAAGGRHVDYATPLADVRLPGGLRVHVALPPVAACGPLISIRIPTSSPPTLGLFLPAERADAAASPFRSDPSGEAGARRGRSTASASPTDRLRAAVRGRENILIVGGTGSGKTTLLGALIGEVPSSDRVVVVEDVAEVASTHPHLVTLEARQPNTDGRGEVDLAALVRASLRMRPDRIVVGECRGAEISELLAALNTGHSGSMATLHANGLDAVPARLGLLGHLAGLPPAALAAQVCAAIDLVVVLERRGANRCIAGFGTPHLAQGALAIRREARDDQDRRG